MPHHNPSQVNTDPTQSTDKPPIVLLFEKDVFETDSYTSTPYNVHTLSRVLLDKLPRGEPLTPTEMQQLVTKYTGIRFPDAVMSRAEWYVERYEDYPYTSNITILLYLVRAHGEVLQEQEPTEPSTTEYPVHPAFDMTSGSLHMKITVGLHLTCHRTKSAIKHYCTKLKNVVSRDTPTDKSNSQSIPLRNN